MISSRLQMLSIAWRRGLQYKCIVCTLVASRVADMRKSHAVMPLLWSNRKSSGPSAWQAKLNVAKLAATLPNSCQQSLPRDEIRGQHRRTVGRISPNRTRPWEQAKLSKESKAAAGKPRALAADKNHGFKLTIFQLNMLDYDRQAETVSACRV